MRLLKDYINELHEQLFCLRKMGELTLQTEDDNATIRDSVARKFPNKNLRMMSRIHRTS